MTNATDNQQSPHDATRDGTNSDASFAKMESAIAGELLKQAQSLVQAQIAASTAIDSKLSALFSQSISLSIATFAASTLPLAKDAWLPGWSGVGLAGAGLISAIAAIIAAWGLRCSKWAAPGLRPSKTFFPKIVHGKVSEALTYLAWAYEESATENDTNLTNTEYWHKASLYTLATAPMIGVVSAFSIWSIYNAPWIFIIFSTLALGLAIRGGPSIARCLVRFCDMIRANWV